MKLLSILVRGYKIPPSEFYNMPYHEVKAFLNELPKNKEGDIIV